MRLVVDAMNVIGSRPTGWWRDRSGAVRDLLDRAQALVAATGDQVVLVLDAVPEGLTEGVHDGVRVVRARRRGRDATDDRIVELVADDPRPAGIHVVSSDRDLCRRVRALDAQVWRPQELLRRLDAL